MPQEEPVVPGEGASSGRELAAKWAQDEARAGVKRVGKGMLLLALVLLLGAFLTPNPEVTYSTGPGRTIGWSGCPEGRSPACRTGWNERVPGPRVRGSVY